MTRAAMILIKCNEAGLAMKMPGLANMGSGSRGPSVSMPKMSSTSSSMPSRSTSTYSSGSSVDKPEISSKISSNMPKMK